MKGIVVGAMLLRALNAQVSTPEFSANDAPPVATGAPIGAPAVDDDLGLGTPSVDPLAPAIDPLAIPTLGDAPIPLDAAVPSDPVASIADIPGALSSALAPTDFGPAPTLPSLGDFGQAPTLPSLGDFGPAPTLPSLGDLGPAPTLPSLGDFGPAPTLPSLSDFAAPLGPPGNSLALPSVPSLDTALALPSPSDALPSAPFPEASVALPPAPFPEASVALPPAQFPEPSGLGVPSVPTPGLVPPPLPTIADLFSSAGLGSPLLPSDLPAPAVPTRTPIILGAPSPFISSPSSALAGLATGLPSIPLPSLDFSSLLNPVLGAPSVSGLFGARPTGLLGPSSSTFGSTSRTLSLGALATPGLPSFSPLVGPSAPLPAIPDLPVTPPRIGSPFGGGPFSLVTLANPAATGLGAGLSKPAGLKPLAVDDPIAADAGSVDNLAAGNVADAYDPYSGYPYDSTDTSNTGTGSQYDYGNYPYNYENGYPYNYDDRYPPSYGYPPYGYDGQYPPPPPYGYPGYPPPYGDQWGYENSEYEDEYPYWYYGDKDDGHYGHRYKHGKHGGDKYSNEYSHDRKHDSGDYEDDCPEECAKYNWDDDDSYDPKYDDKYTHSKGDRYGNSDSYDDEYKKTKRGSDYSDYEDGYGYDDDYGYGYDDYGYGVEDYDDYGYGDDYDYEYGYDDYDPHQKYRNGDYDDDYDRDHDYGHGGYGKGEDDSWEKGVGGFGPDSKGKGGGEEGKGQGGPPAGAGGPPEAQGGKPESSSSSEGGKPEASSEGGKPEESSSSESSEEGEKSEGEEGSESGGKPKEGRRRRRHPRDLPSVADASGLSRAPLASKFEWPSKKSSSSDYDSYDYDYDYDSYDDDLPDWLKETSHGREGKKYSDDYGYENGYSEDSYSYDDGYGKDRKGKYDGGRLRCPKSCRAKYGKIGKGEEGGRPGGEGGKPGGEGPGGEGGKPTGGGGPPSGAGGKPSGAGGKPSGAGGKPTSAHGGRPSSSAKASSTSKSRAKGKTSTTTTTRTSFLTVSRNVSGSKTTSEATASSVEFATTFLTTTSTKVVFETPGAEAETKAAEETSSSPSSSASESEDDGDTWTGSTLADVCPKTCDPFNPWDTGCDKTTTGCVTTGGSKYYCACRAGYRADGYNAKDFSKQIHIPGQPYIYVAPGVSCNTVCGPDDLSCKEVLERPKCK